MIKYDLIIIGAGPAGLTAAIYAARYKLNVLVIGKLTGGMASEAYEVCNFPSYERILGFELITKMIKQVKELGVEIKMEQVNDIEKNKKEGNFLIKTNKEKYLCKKIILATGGERKRLEIDREREFIGKGISYCTTCDAGFYRDKIVAVVGGSDAALTSALLLSKFAKKVYIIYRKDKFFRGDQRWIEEVEQNKKIEPVFNSIITKLIGREKLEAVELNNKIELKVDGIFVEIGSIPKTELAYGIGIKVDGKYIKVDKKQRTNVSGIFAAGDATNNPLKQIITACSEGAIAADSVYRELI